MRSLDWGNGEDESATADVYPIVSIGSVRSRFSSLEQAPRQGREAQAEGEILIHPQYAEGVEDIHAGDRLWVLLWFHAARRDVLRVHPKGDRSVPLTGVFSTRSPDRPNPVGMCLVEVLEVKGCCLRVLGLDALDGTPVVDIKPHRTELDD